MDLHGISQASFDLIVAEEVSSRARYEARYRHPEWPGEQSGVTIGIGYDVGQNSRQQFLADWTGRIPDEMVSALAKTCGVTGPAARSLAAKLHWVDVPWDAALDVFAGHDVPRYLAMARAACPGFDRMPPDCKGVILSLTFNRGASFSKAGERYAEMRGIRDCIKRGDYARIPGFIRSMKRLWPDSKGLRDRRDREAALFERGLKSWQPEKAHEVDGAPEPVDPQIVMNVQRQLKQLGYYQVGNVDGSLVPGGKAEDAILAFRNKNGLPLTPAIDDELLTALAKARPPEIAEERATATADDLRQQGSETIGFTDKVKSLAGKIFGTSLGGGSVLAIATDQISKVSDAKAAVGALGLSSTAWAIITGIVAVAVVAAGMAVGIWYVAHRIEQKRLADYRIGKNP